MNAVSKINYKKSAVKYFLIDLGLWIIKSKAMQGTWRAMHCRLWINC